MASSSRDEDAARPLNKEGENPFIAFRRFADEQVSSFLQGIIGLPSVFTSPSPSARWSMFDEDMQSRDKEMRRSDIGSNPEDWERRTSKKSSGADEGTEIPVERYLESRQVANSLAHDPSLFRFLNPMWHSRDMPMSLLSAFIDESIFAPWPLGYLVADPYSPLHLERDERFQLDGSKWKDAFEDLLLAGEGKELPERQKGFKPDTYAHGGQWIADMLTRGTLGQWKRMETYEDRRLTPLVAPSSPFHFALSEEEERETEKETETEMDTYSHFWRHGPSCLVCRFEKEQAETPPEIDPTPAPQMDTERTAADTHKPDIMSTLTTTERTTLPDGTVHSKIVLKKRFTNGREESSETIHTTQGSTSVQPQETSPTADQEKLRSKPNSSSASTQNGSKNKGGWFWSG
ncbi:MAG: hypothetical protein M1827_000303 [Pycnora praestabilis]|nr:MAG: hypothetical protein M1827_000303 [Pycnora praestabilis]